jgi:hypothetical protein
MNVRLLPAVPLLVLGLAACGPGKVADDGIASAGKGTATPTASASPSASADMRAAQLKFTQCMREHGVNMPDPGPDGKMGFVQKKGDDHAKAEKAMKACQPLMQKAVGDKMGKPDPQMIDKLVKYARCMREHGMDMPDPGPEGQLRIKVNKGGEQKFKEAEKACASLAPGRPS